MKIGNPTQKLGTVLPIFDAPQCKSCLKDNSWSPCFNSCRRQFIASAHTRIQHVFNKYPVPLGRIIDHYVRNCAHKLAVPNDGAALHECGQEGTTHLYNILIISTSWVKKIAFFSRIQCVSCDSHECERDIFLDFSAFVGNVLPWTIPRGKFW